jgi:tetratricopeptide (TPR) repeat protein
VVGDPAIQLIDTLAGATIARMAAGEQVARAGEIIVDAPTAAHSQADIVAWRERDGASFAILNAAQARGHSIGVQRDDWSSIPESLLRAWILPPVYAALRAELGEFLTELRPAVALFLGFAGIDYDLAAATIEELYPGDTIHDDALLEHWHAAGDLAQALPYLRRVAHRLIGISGQYEQARRLIERGLSQLHRDDPRRVPLLIASTWALRQTGQYPAARETAMHAMQLAERAGDHLGVADCLSYLGQLAQPGRTRNGAE